MKKRRLGRGGPMVSAIGLGCMSFGGTCGPTTANESLRYLEAARGHGIDFLDTVNIFGLGDRNRCLATGCTAGRTAFYRDQSRDRRWPAPSV